MSSWRRPCQRAERTGWPHLRTTDRLGDAWRPSAG
jgi:hypothetical protein